MRDLKSNFCPHKNHTSTHHHPIPGIIWLLYVSSTAVQIVVQTASVWQYADRKHILQTWMPLGQRLTRECCPYEHTYTYSALSHRMQEHAMHAQHNTRQRYETHRTPSRSVYTTYTCLLFTNKHAQHARAPSAHFTIVLYMHSVCSIYILYDVHAYGVIECDVNDCVCECLWCVLHCVCVASKPGHVEAMQPFRIHLLLRSLPSRCIVRLHINVWCIHSVYARYWMRIDRVREWVRVSADYTTIV